MGHSDRPAEFYLAYSTQAIKLDLTPTRRDARWIR